MQYAPPEFCNPNLANPAGETTFTCLESAEQNNPGLTFRLIFEKHPAGFK
jgi:hypothetical protein